MGYIVFLLSFLAKRNHSRNAPITPENFH